MSELPTAPPRATIHVVDDDDALRKATARLLRAAGHEVRTYPSAAEFLATGGVSPPACALLDLRMPGLSGLDVQERLDAWNDPPAVVFVSGHGQVADSVRALRRGAVDFLTKPVDAAELLGAIERALAREAEQRAQRSLVRELRERYERLTRREREVLPHLVAGQLNKQTAFDLGTAERTIKAHRASILEKMQAASIADLVRMADALGIAPADVSR
jgi:FixJ family two-component response regulator